MNIPIEVDSYAFWGNVKYENGVLSFWEDAKWEQSEYVDRLIDENMGATASYYFCCCIEDDYFATDDYEGKYFPYLSDEVYYGLKTLVFDIIDVQEGENPGWGMPWGPAMMRVMTGWWSPQFMDDFEPKVGLWELPITQEMAEWCAHSNKNDADGNARNRDLTLMMTRGSVTIKSVYYEE